jgi:hypothetical protein
MSTDARRNYDGNRKLWGDKVAELWARSTLIVVAGPRDTKRGSTPDRDSRLMLHPGHQHVYQNILYFVRVFIAEMFPECCRFHALLARSDRSHHLTATI